MSFAEKYGDRWLERLQAKLLAAIGDPNPTKWERLGVTAQRTLTRAINQGTDAQANIAWFLGEAIECWKKWVEIYAEIKSKAYYDAWCKLERIEIDATSLLRNRFCDPTELKLDLLLTQVEQVQSLFPYRAFASPEFIVRRRTCSVCGADVTPWSNCGHDKGKVYRGHLCVHMIQEMDLVSISIVENPVQKYSVLFLDGGEGASDHYNYDAVDYLFDRIRSPFSGWTLTWTNARHPHSLYSHVKPGDPCPCDSGAPYQSCCLPQPGVLRPHAQIEFEEYLDAITPGFETVQLIGYGTRQHLRVDEAGLASSEDNALESREP
jgi:hypothetical protein